MKKINFKSVVVFIFLIVVMTTNSWGLECDSGDTLLLGRDIVLWSPDSMEYPPTYVDICTMVGDETSCVRAGEFPSVPSKEDLECLLGKEVRILTSFSDATIYYIFEEDWQSWLASPGCEGGFSFGRALVVEEDSTGYSVRRVMCANRTELCISYRWYAEEPDAFALESDFQITLYPEAFFEDLEAGKTFYVLQEDWDRWHPKPPPIPPTEKQKAAAVGAAINLLLLGEE